MEELKKIDENWDFDEFVSISSLICMQALVLRIVYVSWSYRIRLKDN